MSEDNVARTPFVGPEGRIEVPEAERLDLERMGVKLTTLPPAEPEKEADKAPVKKEKA